MSTCSPSEFPGSLKMPNMGTIMPNMGTMAIQSKKEQSHSMVDALFSKTQQKVLALRITKQVKK